MYNILKYLDYIDYKKINMQEILRQKLLKKVFIFSIIYFFALVLIFSSAFFCIYYLIVAILIAFLLTKIIYDEVEKINVDYKKYLVDNFYKNAVKIFQNIKYEKKIIDRYFLDTVKTSLARGMLVKHGFVCDYNGANFVINECIFTDYYSNKKNNILDKGIAVLIDLNLKMNGTFVISPKFSRPIHSDCIFLLFIIVVLFSLISFLIYFDSEEKQIIGLLIFLLVCACVHLHTINFSYYLKKQKSGDKEIDKLVDIFSSNTDNYQSHVTRELITQFLNIRKTFKESQIQCTFMENKVLIFIKTHKTHFDIGNVFTPISKYLTIGEFYQKIKPIYNFIDTLK